MLGKLGFMGIVGLALAVVVSQSGGRAAQATLTQSCPAGAGAVTVALVWPAAAEGSLETWLDLGLSEQFYAAATQSYGPFDPAQTSYAVAALPERVTYHYRVQARTPEGWVKVAGGSFEARCGVPPVPGAVTQRCVEGPEPGPADDGVAATLTWRADTPGEQWLDVSAAGPEFAAGSYAGHGPVPAGTTAREIGGLGRGVTYWWRVNVRTPGGWLAGAPASFVTARCPR